MGQIAVDVLRPAVDGAANVTATLAGEVWSCADGKFLDVLNAMRLPTGYYPDPELARAMDVVRCYGGRIIDDRGAVTRSGDVEMGQ